MARVPENKFDFFVDDDTGDVSWYKKIEGARQRTLLFFCGLFCFDFWA